MDAIYTYINQEIYLLKISASTFGNRYWGNRHQTSKIMVYIIWGGLVPLFTALGLVSVILLGPALLILFLTYHCYRFTRIVWSGSRPKASLLLVVMISSYLVSYMVARDQQILRYQAHSSLYSYRVTAGSLSPFPEKEEKLSYYYQMIWLFPMALETVFWRIMPSSLLNDLAKEYPLNPAVYQNQIKNPNADIQWLRDNFYRSKPFELLVMSRNPSLTIDLYKKILEKSIRYNFNEVNEDLRITYNYNTKPSEFYHKISNNIWHYNNLKQPEKSKIETLQTKLCAKELYLPRLKQALSHKKLSINYMSCPISCYVTYKDIAEKYYADLAVEPDIKIRSCLIDQIHRPYPAHMETLEKLMVDENPLVRLKTKKQLYFYFCKDDCNKYKLPRANKYIETQLALAKNDDVVAMLLASYVYADIISDWKNNNDFSAIHDHYYWYLKAKLTWQRQVEEGNNSIPEEVFEAFKPQRHNFPRWKFPAHIEQQVLEEFDHKYPHSNYQRNSGDSIPIYTTIDLISIKHQQALYKGIDLKGVIEETRR